MKRSGKSVVRDADPRRGAIGPGCAAIFLATLLPGHGLALPSDPQRPFTAQTCAEALARLAEAKTGSPLISDAEMEEVLRQAFRQADKLCGSDHDALSDFEEIVDPQIQGD